MVPAHPAPPAVRSAHILFKRGRTVPDPAYVSHPTVCERLEDLLPRFGGTRELLRPAARVAEGERPEATRAERVDYPPPTEASAAMRIFLQRHTTFRPEPVFIAGLPGGRVFGPGAVIAPDGRSLARDVSADFGKPFDQHWLLTYKKMRPPVHVPGSTAVAAVTLGEGYAHWLLEELPRLLLIVRERPDVNVIAHTGATFIREALAFGRFSQRVSAAGRYSHFECEQLIIPGLIGESGHPTPRILALLAEFTAPLRDQGAAAASRFGERLYLTRERAGRRRVINEPELWRRLETHGFVKMAPEDLSWSDQINAFAHAKVIVAPHGAGLANLAFCPPGVRVVELFNPTYVNPCFWRLSGVNGLDYRPIVPADDGPITCDPKSNRRDIHADVTAVVNALIGA